MPGFFQYTFLKFSMKEVSQVMNYQVTRERCDVDAFAFNHSVSYKASQAQICSVKPIPLEHDVLERFS